jgi:hypothetical protein
MRANRWPLCIPKCATLVHGTSVTLLLRGRWQTGPHIPHPVAFCSIDLDRSMKPLAIGPNLYLAAHSCNLPELLIAESI